MKQKIIIIIALLTFVNRSFGQNVLPNISIQRGVKNAVIISWKNNYGDQCIQINVQRSVDSMKNFRTIFTVPSPELPANAYSDRPTDTIKYFYRVFIMLQGGAYYFSPSHTAPPIAAIDTTPNLALQEEIVEEKKPLPKVIAPIKIPTLLNATKNGSVYIKLPEDELSKYSMIIKKEYENDTLFQIKRFADPFLIIDKSSFRNSGSYDYIIYKDHVEVERNRFQIQK